MRNRLMIAAVTVLLFGTAGFAGAKGKSTGKVIYGVVTDTHCGLAMSTASAAHAACVKKCVAGGAKYALASHGKLYQLEPQEKFSEFSGKHVRVYGHVNGDAISAVSVRAVVWHPKKKAS